jgi:hypothetical protein
MLLATNTKRMEMYLSCRDRKEDAVLSKSDNIKMMLNEREKTFVILSVLVS